MANGMFQKNQEKQHFNRAQELEDFAAVLMDESIRSSAVSVLPAVLTEALKNEFDRKELAKLGDTSEPTIGRWIAEQVVPRPPTARDVIRAIAERALQKAHSFRSQIEVPK